MRGEARLAIPGDPETPTGGYIYDRRVIAASGGALTALPLPDGFPFPDAAALEETRAALAAAGRSTIVDGLAYGALPAALIDSLPMKPLALCHHPLGMETGLAAATARRLIETERAALARAAHVLVTSAETKRLLVAEFGLAEGRVSVAPPGLDRARASLEQRGVIHSIPIILCVATITPRKDHATLVSALARLDEMRPALAWRAIFAGAGDRAPETAAALRRQIGNAGLGDRIELVGSKSEGELDALYERASVFALASRYEGYGMAYAEALMRGLPVVAADVGAAGAEAPEVARRLFPAGDAAALADRLAELLEDEDARRKAGAAARAHALTLPGWAETWAIFRRALEAAG